MSFLYMPRIIIKLSLGCAALIESEMHIFRHDAHMPNARESRNSFLDESCHSAQLNATKRRKFRRLPTDGNVTVTVIVLVIVSVSVSVTKRRQMHRSW